MKMHSVVLFLSATLWLANSSCKQIEEEQVCDFPSGMYTNATVLAHCSTGDMAGVPYVFLEMDFKKNNMVVLDNGIEKFSVPVVSTDKACVFKISHPSLFGELEFNIKADGSIALIDTEKTKLDSASRFEKRMDSEGNGLRFTYCLNDCLFAGEYILFKDGVEEPGFVTVLTNGQLNGLTPYLGYKLCFGENCNDGYTTIDMFDVSGKRETFILKSNGNKSMIELFMLAEHSGGNNGQISQGQLIFTLKAK